MNVSHVVKYIPNGFYYDIEIINIIYSSNQTACVPEAMPEVSQGKNRYRTEKL